MSRKNDFYVNINLNVRGLHPSATLAINEKSNQLIREGKTIHKLGLGQSPFPVPDRIVKALEDNAFQKDYLPVRGLGELREAVASFNKRTQKIDCKADDIIIGPGSKELIFLLQLVYYGDLIIPTPSWVSYAPQARIVGRHVQWVQTMKDNNWRLSGEQLEMICRTDPNRPRIVILNYPSNPTGCTYPIERLKLLAKVARKYKVVLISDEIYGLMHHNAQHVSVARFYPEGTIISNGLSKWCGAGGWRLGTFTFPSTLHWLRDAMAIVASETFTATSAPIQYAAITAFEGGDDIDEYLCQSRRILKILAKILVTRLEKMHVDVPVPQGGFYLFPDFGFYRNKLNKRGIYTSVELCNTLLNETGVAMLPGNDFGRFPEELTARIAYVDFNGREVMKAASSEPYQDKSLDLDFADKYCHHLLLAFDKLESWFNSL